MCVAQRNRNAWDKSGQENECGHNRGKAHCLCCPFCLVGKVFWCRNDIGIHNKSFFLEKITTLLYTFTDHKEIFKFRKILRSERKEDG